MFLGVTTIYPQILIGGVFQPQVPRKYIFHTPPSILLAADPNNMCYLIIYLFSIFLCFMYQKPFLKLLDFISCWEYCMTRTNQFYSSNWLHALAHSNNHHGVIFSTKTMPCRWWALNPQLTNWAVHADPHSFYGLLSYQQSHCQTPKYVFHVKMEHRASLLLNTLFNNILGRMQRLTL